jgi:hypothetical protein
MVKWTKANVTGVDERELNSIVTECLYSTHAMMDLVYRQSSGSPSGAYFTTIINSMVNQMYVFLAWDALVGRDLTSRGINQWDEFKKNVVLTVYGDDLMCTVHTQYLALFNATTITSFFAKYGIVALNATKEETIKPYGPLSEASFLKSGFIPHPKWAGEWLSPLDWDSVIDMTQWIWETADYKEATRLNAYASLLSAYSHGPEKFETHRAQVNSALRYVRVDPIILRWEDLDTNFYPQFYGGLKSPLGVHLKTLMDLMQ